MKKVRYAWGAVGAVGAVPALAVMPAGPAATAHAQETAAKTVSLQHGAAAAGCTGSTAAKASLLNVKLEFWHTYHPAYDTSCIGTVNTSFYVGLSPNSYDRIRIYARSIHGAKHMVYHTSPHGAASPKKFYFDTGIHKSFAYPPIQVCVAAVRSQGSVFEGPLCKSVG